MTTEKEHELEGILIRCPCCCKSGEYTEFRYQHTQKGFGLINDFDDYECSNCRATYSERTLKRLMKNEK